MKSQDFLREGTARTRERFRLRGWHIVGGLVLMMAVFIFLAALNSPGRVEAQTAAFVCPEAPVPFQLRQNVLVEIEGEQVYVACAWVGGVIDIDTVPLP